jgi:hypothetical protein
LIALGCVLDTPSRSDTLRLHSTTARSEETSNEDHQLVQKTLSGLDSGWPGDAERGASGAEQHQPYR